jgi:DNA-binding CsgD family transcriptional regulator
MDNNYHLLIETPDANLSKGMRQLNGMYTQRFNRTHSRVGHLFQGRYKAIVVEKESYLLELARYIVLNPVRARMVRSAKDWPWSSYRATAGQVVCAPWLCTGWLLAAFGKRKGIASERYRQFVTEGRNQPAPWERLKNQVFLGNDAFVERMLSSIDKKTDLSEVPQSQRRPTPKSMDEYMLASKNRNEAIVKAYRSGGYSLKEVGLFFGLHYATVSKIVANAKSNISLCVNNTANKNI